MKNRNEPVLEGASFGLRGRLVYHSPVKGMIGRRVAAMSVLVEPHDNTPGVAGIQGLVVLGQKQVCCPVIAKVSYRVDIPVGTKVWWVDHMSIISQAHQRNLVLRVPRVPPVTILALMSS
jgi:hypothetical protein